MKLSSDKEYLVLENENLVHYLVKKQGVAPSSQEYDDIFSIGRVGLVKAAINFDPSKKIKFSTFASTCINNEILMHFRKANKYANDISIDDPIGNDGEGNDITLGDKIEHPESDFVEKIVNNEAFIDLLSIILNYLKGKERVVMLYLMEHMTQKDIAEKLNNSQSYVSRIAMRATNKIRKVTKNKLHYKEVFSMAIVGDEYRISFSSKDISKFNQVFATLLQKLTSTEKLPDFRVNCNKERIVVQISAHPESFSFIAQIIQELDEYSMAFISNKSETNSKVQNLDVISHDENEAVEIVPEPVSETAVVENAVESETDSKTRAKKFIQVKEVRDYMLSMNSFTVKDLKDHFPNLTTGTIGNALYLAKGKGLITATGRGEYVVNKK